MTDQKIESIKRRIRALLEKREENGATREEAAAALAKASELMAEYMIEKDQLGGGDKRPREFIEKPVRLLTFKFSATNLLTPICKLFNCESYFYDKIFKAVFFGEKQNVELAAYFMDVLQRALFNETQAFRKTAEYKDASRAYGSHAAQRDFQYGFVVGVMRNVERLVNENAERVRSATGKDLVVVENEDLKAAFRAANPELKEKRSRRVNLMSNDALQAGIEAGKRQQLRRGVETDANERFLTTN